MLNIVINTSGFIFVFSARTFKASILFKGGSSFNNLITWRKTI